MFQCMEKQATVDLSFILNSSQCVWTWITKIRSARLIPEWSSNLEESEGRRKTLHMRRMKGGESVRDLWFSTFIGINHYLFFSYIVIIFFSSILCRFTHIQSLNFLYFQDQFNVLQSDRKHKNKSRKWLTIPLSFGCCFKLCKGIPDC